MNLAIGGDGSWPGPADATTPTPARMAVDYVRIYRAAAVSRPRLGSPVSISVTAGATTGNTSTILVRNLVGTGGVFLDCTTTAPKATCQVSTSDVLNSHTLDFSYRANGTAKVTVSTTPDGGTIPGSYAISIHAYPVNASGTTPDATVDIPLTVN